MSKRRIVDEMKFDVGLVPTSLASTSATGKYVPIKEWRKVLGQLLAGAMVAGATAKIELFQAKDQLGTGATLITGATATITSLSNCTAVKITFATFLATGTVTISVTVLGVTTAYVFTAHATTTTIASRQFSISGSDTADGDEFVKCVNDPTYGVPGVFAVNAAGAVTITVIDSQSTVTIASAPDDATSVKATVEAQAAVEADCYALGTQPGGIFGSTVPFTHVAPKVTTAAGTVICAANLTRFGRYNPRQQFAVLASVGV